MKIEVSPIIFFTIKRILFFAWTRGQCHENQPLGISIVYITWIVPLHFLMKFYTYIIYIYIIYIMKLSFIGSARKDELGEILELNISAICTNSQQLIANLQ